MRYFILIAMLAVSNVVLADAVPLPCAPNCTVTPQPKPTPPMPNGPCGRPSCPVPSPGH